MSSVDPAATREPAAAPAAVPRESLARVSTTYLNGLPLRTGDLIFTVDGNRDTFLGEFWLIVGRMIPGVVDHVAIYIGPGRRCVEAGARGEVIAFDLAGHRWEASAMAAERGLIDRLYGIADPIEGRGIPPGQEQEIRLRVAEYCLAQIGKPYNLNFFDSDTEEAFYCSQLVYKAYLPHGIDFNTGRGIPGFEPSRSIVYPQEVWEACPMRARM